MHEQPQAILPAAVIFTDLVLKFRGSLPIL